MVEIIKPSFSKGELAPQLHGRVDTTIYGLGLASARNCIIHTYGGISNRQGTRFIGPIKDHTKKSRLVEFQFKTTDSYILEFGNLYMRVIRDDGHVVDQTPTTITGATQTNPVVVTAASHGLSNGDEVFITGVVGMTELNTNRYKIANVATNTMELTDQVTGANIDGTGFTAYSSAGTVAKIFEIATPYLEAELCDLNFTQSADVMTIVHKNHRIRELSRTDHDAWSLDILTFGPVIGSPTDVTVTGGTGSTTDRYRVTAIDRETGEEGLSALDDVEKTITGATQANPVVISSTSHGFIEGDEVRIDNVVGMTELNTNRYFVSNPNPNDFELTNVAGDTIDGTGFTAYSSAGIIRGTFTQITNSNTTQTNTIAWTAVPAASRYAVYRRSNGIYGLIGETEQETFLDSGFAPVLTDMPPEFRDPFEDLVDQPGAVGYYEQRRVFGGSTDKPDTSEYSQTGNQTNFNKAQPLQPDDAISATLNSLQVNEIRHYVGLNDLLIFTSGSEWRVNSGPDAGFEPTTIKQKPQTYWGSSCLKPITAGNSVLFVTEDKANVRSFGFSLQLDGYTGSNLNILSQHLLLERQIREWAYKRNPESRVYFVMEDGAARTMSFDQEQEVIAWTPWDTDGKYESVETLRGGGDNNEDSVYFIVKRTINGNTVRYIEVFRQHSFTEVEDAFYVDCGLSLDVPVTITGSTAANPVVITATAHGFVNGDEVDITNIEWVPTVDSIGNSTQPDQLNGKRYVVANATANTFELTGEDGSAFSVYVEGGKARKAVSTVSALDHLEGRTVKILADGNVISNLTVTNGVITLPRKFSRVHVGLQYISDVETLKTEAPQGTVQSFKMRISKVVTRFYNSRGLLVADKKGVLQEIKFREFEKFNEPTQMFTGDKEFNIRGRWSRDGRLFFRQLDPLPFTLLAIVPTLEVGDD